MIAIMFTLCSCDDYLTLYPEDEMIEDEYWVSGNNVQNVVASVYRYAADDNVLRKMIYWGELRGDNLSYTTGGTDEENLYNANLLSSSSLTKWDGFYKVINICNLVIDRAPGVRAKDPNFTEERLNCYMSEAYAMRALMYFYLIRAFGDVPYITTPSDSEQKDYQVAQTDDEEILDMLIADLEEKALAWAPYSWDTEEYTHGRITTDAVRCLLADMYLWKASQKKYEGETQYYQKCVDYCDAVINDDRSTHVFSEPDMMYSEVFGMGNASENIFELNFTNGGLANNATASLYGNTSKGTNPHFLPTAQLLSLYSKEDTRRYQYMKLNYVVSGGEAAVNSQFVFKYEGQTPDTDWGVGGGRYRSASSYANWIFYRMADVYLMKAEALAVMGDNSALEMCNVIYSRATENKELLDDTEKILTTVYKERQRELCFEGKRWFDLMRMVRRDGMTDNALALLLVSRTGDNDLYQTRLSSIDAWYVPINKDEMNSNPNLHQNAYYTLKEK